MEVRLCFDNDDLKIIEKNIGTKDLLEFIDNKKNDYNK